MSYVRNSSVSLLFIAGMSSVTTIEWTDRRAFNLKAFIVITFLPRRLFNGNCDLMNCVNLYDECCDSAFKEAENEDRFLDVSPVVMIVDE